MASRLIREYGYLYGGRMDGHYEAAGGAPYEAIIADAIKLANLSPTSRVSFEINTGTTGQVAITVAPDSNLELMIRACKAAREKGITSIGPYPDPVE